MAVKKTTVKTPAKDTKKDTKKDKKDPNGLPLLNYKKTGGDIKYDPVTGEQINVNPVTPTDTTFNVDKVTAGTVSAGKVSSDKVTADTVSADQLANQFYTAADYNMVDPAEISAKYGDIARGEASKNADLSSEIALKQLDTELKGLQSFAPAAAALQRGEVAKDNTFNQAQKDAQLAAVDPSIRSDLEGQAARARTYAAGGVPDSINDKALELGIRSRAADSAAGGGFGVRSSAARKASELMSAEQRIALSKQGDDLLTNNLKSRSDLLFAPLESAQAGSQIKATPTLSGAQLAQDSAKQLNDKTIISSSDVLTNQTQQSQFLTHETNQVGEFNTNLAAQKDFNQANLNLQAGSTNAANKLQADSTTAELGLKASSTNAELELQANSTNASLGLQAQDTNTRNQIATQTTAIQTQSQEKQFNANLALNLGNANADRSFSAANANAGRALQVAESNRSTRLQIQTTNNNMIFQDQQARKAEAAANARAAAAERGANARAAMSAAASQAAIAANLEAQKSAQAFSLQQQQQALDVQKQGIAAGQHAADVAATGGLIARAPSVISGVGSIASGIAAGYNYFFGDDVSAAGQDTAVFFA